MSQPRRSSSFSAARLGLALICALSWTGAPARAQAVPPLKLTPVASGLTRPVGIVAANDASGRLFIVEQGGTIRIWDGAQLLPDPFLSIPVLCCGERGLLGLAFHPRFSTNGYFYVHYSNPSGGVVDLLDDFQDETLQGWGVGRGDTPYPPRVERDAGPGGADDHALRIESDGGGGPGSRLVVFNETQWAGNYTGDGLSEIAVDLRNLGDETLVIRLGLRGVGGDVASLRSATLPPGSDWTTMSFPIEPAEFTGTGADAAATLAAVSQLRILHNPLPEFIGEPFPGRLAIDNVRAMRLVNGGDGASVLSRFRVTSDPNVADPSSEVVLLTQPQPYGNHNGGQIAFGPDEYLYMALGDGGSANDPQNHGQNLGDLLGTVLRLDVPADENDPRPRLAIPADNPFVGVPGARPEIWAYGLRNPWRFSFDRLTGDLFIADVGQGRFEEINFQLAGSGGGENYGWRRMEGSSCFDPPSGCNDGTLTLPVMEYDHSQGCSVTGGYRYRGRLYPSLDGIFFFGDYCSGLLWSGVEDALGAWSASVALASGLRISTFGEDEDGEIYLADLSSGGLFRLEADLEPPRITAPASGTVLPAGGMVTALGTGTNLSWRVDRLGDALPDLATGTGFAITFTVPADSTAQQEILVELTGDGGVDTIVYPIGPLAPPLEATAAAEPTSGAAPLAVQFTGDASGGTEPYLFEWSFGDGSPLSNEPSPVHVYAQGGSYTATLTVRDASFATVSVEIPIEVSEAAPLLDCSSVTFLRALSRGEHLCAQLGRSGLPYTDDARTLAAVPPALEGTAWIRLAQADASKRGPFHLFLRVSEPVTVVVGFDAAAERLPFWLRRRWTPEGESVTLDDGRVLDLYAREYGAGWIFLGGNAAGATWIGGVDPLHYVVALRPASPASSATMR